MAAFLTREDLDIGQDRALGHFTHEKIPAICAAALGTLDHRVGRSCRSEPKPWGPRFLEQLKELQTRHPLIYEVRGRGLLLAIILRRPDDSPADERSRADNVRRIKQGSQLQSDHGLYSDLDSSADHSEQHLTDALNILARCFTELKTIW